MYNSIIDTDMFTLRGSHELERMDDIQLADLGIERNGNAFLIDSRVVHETPKFDAGTLLTRIKRIIVAAALGSRPAMAVTPASTEPAA